MIPPEVVASIPNLLISTTEHGVSDHESLLAAYKYLSRRITQLGIKRPVQLITDGHSSRFDEGVLGYTSEKEMPMYILPPDTSGVTQKHDQVS